MPFDYNEHLHRGWVIQEFTIGGEVHYRAIKDGTTIANPNLNALIDIIDELDFSSHLRYNN